MLLFFVFFSHSDRTLCFNDCNWYFLPLRYIHFNLAMPITIYTTICQFFTVFVPTACLISIYTLKYFHTSLIYIITMMICKIIQILSVEFFTRKQLGICIVPLSTRIPVGIVGCIELISMFICIWLLKRVRKVNREAKIQKVITQKAFLSDVGEWLN